MLIYRSFTSPHKVLLDNADLDHDDLANRPESSTQKEVEGAERAVGKERS